ncbi:hypothetical protein H3H36_00290 [Duganella sp. FT3S]|uniref:Recombinase domain-containing protein n=1 Tax=Rugamonas fusca TaxID=2758568 RepID=A0A7W2I521_9BURK|nr:hypothetical protein [Rugamonas fusca]MBA5603800.1 hypothetical protein [Rugamonas fusca]
MPDRAATAARRGTLPGPVQGIDQTVLRMIAALRSGGQTFHRIAALLNRCGIAAPLGGRWYGASVRQVLLRNQPA